MPAITTACDNPLLSSGEQAFSATRIFMQLEIPRIEQKRLRQEDLDFSPIPEYGLALLNPIMHIALARRLSRLFLETYISLPDP
jgi:hypothetical protein